MMAATRRSNGVLSHSASEADSGERETCLMTVRSLEIFISGSSRKKGSYFHQSSQRDQIACLNPLDFYSSAPESGDLRCKPGTSRTTV